MTLPNGILQADVRIQYTIVSIGRVHMISSWLQQREQGDPLTQHSAWQGYLTRGLTSTVSTCLMARFIEERIIRFVEAARIMRQFTNPRMKQEWPGRKMEILVYLNIYKRTRKWRSDALSTRWTLILKPKRKNTNVSQQRNNSARSYTVQSWTLLVSTTLWRKMMITML